MIRDSPRTMFEDETDGDGGDESDLGEDGGGDEGNVFNSSSSTSGTYIHVCIVSVRY